MTKAILYSREGCPLQAITSDPRMTSRLDSDRAIETWQAGLVCNMLSVRVKTVDSLDRLLRNAQNGSLVKITYQAFPDGPRMEETLVVHQIGGGRLPLFVPYQQPAFSDRQIVWWLQAELGAYITVTYQLFDRQPAPLEGRQPVRELADQRHLRILVAL